MARYAVIGLGRFGQKLAVKLARAGAEVIAIDCEAAMVDKIRDSVPLAVCLNSLDEEALRAQGVDEVDVAVVGIGKNFEDSALTTVILKKKLKINRVISRATSTIRGDILTQLGADDIVNPESEAADRWCNYLLAPSSIVERFALPAGHSLVQIAAPRQFHGKTLKDLAVRTNYHVNVVAVRRTSEQHDTEGKVVSRRDDLLVAMPDSEVQPNDILFLIGKDEDIKNFPAA